MIPIEFVRSYDVQRKLIKQEMAKEKMTIRELAGLANLRADTVVGFLEHTTFSPHHRTVLSLLQALDISNTCCSKTGELVQVIPRRLGRKADEA